MIPPLTLASASPRRRQLLTDIGFQINVVPANITENYPSQLPANEVPEYIAKEKAVAVGTQMQVSSPVIAADTVVILENQIIGKPVDRRDAIEMLTLLSGKMHTVITGVAFYFQGRIHSFSVSTHVYFDDLTLQEITYYVDKYQPFDKAGSYGIQEWIGLRAVKKIEGCFYNVMGLPVSAVYQELHRFLGIPI